MAGLSPPTVGKPGPFSLLLLSPANCLPDAVVVFIQAATQREASKCLIHNEEICFRLSLMTF